ncbi:hypothetical protein CapIbe_024163 [Capra ibex]
MWRCRMHTDTKWPVETNSVTLCLLKKRLIHELTASRRAEPESHEEKQGSQTKTRFGVSGPAHHHVESALI